MELTVHSIKRLHGTECRCYVRCYCNFLPMPTTRIRCFVLDTLYSDIFVLMLNKVLFRFQLIRTWTWVFQDWIWTLNFRLDSIMAWAWCSIFVFGFRQPTLFAQILHQNFQVNWTWPDLTLPKNCRFGSNSKMEYEVQAIIESRI